MTDKIELLRQDRRGRVRVPVERREALLDEFERSGMSAAAFAAFVGVKYQTFITWRRKRKRKRNRSGQRPKQVSEPDDAIRWLEAVVTDPPPVRAEGGLTVELPGGARLAIVDAMQARLAAELLRALGGGRTC